MSLHQRGQWQYGDTQADIREELIRVGGLNAYVPTQFADARCPCGSAVFGLRVDENEGVALRTCVSCSQTHPIGDSGDFIEDANPDECVCPCGGDKFEITIGVHLYANTSAVRWLYVGCRCSICGLTANYGDWKNEFEDYRQLLSQV